MHVHCETCNAMIHAEDMNLATGMAKCRFCHAVFRLPEAVFPAARAEPGARREAYETAGEPRRVVPRPAKVTVTQQGGVLTINRPWFSPVYLFLVFFCVLWFGFLAFWYTLAFAANAPLLFFLFPLIHVAAGVAIAYTTLAGFVNHTVVAVGNGRLSVRHGPLPWRGNRTLPTAALQQLYCDDVLVRTRNGSRRTFRLHAVLRDGSKLQILSGIDDADVPLFVERQVEDWLGIEDQRVAGELGR